jgi:nucleoid DNA-binding protein
MTKKKKFTSSDIVRGLSHLEGVSESQAKSILDHTIELIILALLRGDQVYLPKLGSFVLVLTRTKEGVHPKTLDPLAIPPALKLRFRVSSTISGVIKNYVNRFLENKLEKMTPQQRDSYYSHEQKISENVESKRKARGIAPQYSGEGEV